MEYYDSGLQFISNITRCREKINSLKDRINYGHKMIQANKGSDYQKDVIKDAEEELILFENEEKVGISTYFSSIIIIIHLNPILYY